MATTAVAVMVVSGCVAADESVVQGGASTSSASDVPEVAPSIAVGVPVVDTITVAGARSALEAGQDEIRRILDSEIGPQGWTEARPAQENSSTSCGGTPGVGKFYAAEMTHPDALSGEQWDRAWAEIVRSVAEHGFRPAPDSAEGADSARAAGGGHYEYLVNEHHDELTVSSQPRIGTGSGGFSVCHPWD